MVKTSKKVVAKAVTKRRKGKQTFNSYIYKVMKQVHPESRISKKGMLIVNNFVMDTFDRVCTEASKLCKYAQRSTLGAREVQSALRLVLPGELSKHAVSEGTKAMTKFNSA